MKREIVHAALGASGASRWMACPGSIKAEEGLPDNSSAYSREGTAAHALAEMALVRGRHPSDWLDEDITVTDDETGETFDIHVDEEMVAAVGFYTQYVRKVTKGADELFVEHKFDLAPIKPPGEMLGTADVAARRERHLDVIDLKYGKGVHVSAVGNVQGRYYALGAWVELAVKDKDLALKMKDVTIHIVQPRLQDSAGEPLVTTDTITIAELREWAKQELLPAAKETLAPDAPRRPGDHCKFCKAKPSCSEFRGQALAVAKTDFDALDNLPAVKQALPSPILLTVEELGTVGKALPVLEDWIASMYLEITGRIERGQAIPGFAMAPTRPTRKWTQPPAEVAQALAAAFDAEPDEFFEQKIKSPAQVEKVVGKGKIPDGLVIAESSGTKLVRDTDPAALPTSAANDFVNA